MNLTDANTEPFYRFHRFHEEFNRTIRMTVAGLALVRQQPSAGGPVALPTDGEPFGKNLWNNPAKWVLSAKRYVAQMGIVRVVASLEDFCVGVKAERDRFAAIKGDRVDGDSHDQEDAEGLSPMSLYARLGWEKDVLTGVEPLFTYFSKARNCIVHRSARASKDLATFSIQSGLIACVSGWKGPRNKRLPSLPAVSAGIEVSFLPRHAVLSSEVCRRIAVDANERLLNYLGDDGVVCMAAHHSLLSDEPITMDARKSARAILNYLLTSRYRVKLQNRDEAVQVLSRMGKWKPYLRRYERL